MFQFFNGTDEVFADLEAQAREACIVFIESMPPGVVPAAARVGFEVNPENGCATLFVDKDLNYQGDSDAVRRWIEDGELEFTDFNQLRDWIRNNLKAVYEGTYTDDMNDSDNHTVRLDSPPCVCLPVNTDTQQPPAEPDDI